MAEGKFDLPEDLFASKPGVESSKLKGILLNPRHCRLFHNIGFIVLCNLIFESATRFDHADRFEVSFIRYS